MSNQSIPVLVLTVKAAAALTRYRAVTAGGAHAATAIYGVTASDAAIGSLAAVNVVGTTPLEAGAAIPIGTAFLIADANGRAIAGGTAAECLARLCPGQFATGAGDVVEGLLSLGV